MNAVEPTCGRRLNGLKDNSQWLVILELSGRKSGRAGHGTFGDAVLHVMLGAFLGTRGFRHVHRHRRMSECCRSRAHAKRHQQHSNENQEPGDQRPHERSITTHIDTIQTAMKIIIRFSVSEMKPSGTLLDPPTQAHFSSRLSM